MAYDQRKKIIAEIEKLRGGRSLICFFNFDRLSEHNGIGLSTQFHAEAKESLFRILKESKNAKGIDLCLYTRGGDTNSVWPLVNLIREFDKDFEVLVPFRCHSSGTLMALGARKIVLGPLSELSPIDPSTGNQFNPQDPTNPKNRLAISVEDVRAYATFVKEQLLGGSDTNGSQVDLKVLQPSLQQLSTQVHPLALGNVQRVLLQIKQLATKLLSFHANSKDNIDQVVDSLTTKFYSHVHMIGRDEAKEILGTRVLSASAKLSLALDKLLRSYEDNFQLRRTFYLSSFLGDKTEADVRFIGGVIECKQRSYLYETKATVRQYSKLPPTVQVQIPAGQPMPIIPGVPRETQIEIRAQGWIHNKEPIGVTT